MEIGNSGMIEFEAKKELSLNFEVNSLKPNFA